MRKKVVGFTFNLESAYIHQPGDPPDAHTEFDREPVIKRIENAIKKLGFDVFRIGSLDNLLKQYPKIKDKIDIVFNISEGFRGRNREAEIPIVLESLGIPYVGSDGLTMSLTLDKVFTKKILLQEGIPTAKYADISDPHFSPKQVSHLKYPLIVKPRWEGSSKGLTENSKVRNLKELKRQVGYIIKIYKQPALVEEFITGREFTVPLIGNKKVTILPVLEVVAQGNALHDLFYLNRHIDTDELDYECPAKITAFVQKKLEQLALKTYRAVECKDFGRVDIRVDAKGHPYVLEINPLPALAISDAFGIVAKYLKKDFSKIVQQILIEALRRYGMKVA